MGCDEAINYTKDNVAERVRELTDGKGVPMVYDGVGLRAGKIEIEVNQTYALADAPKSIRIWKDEQQLT